MAFPISEIRVVRGRPQLFVNGHPEFCMMGLAVTTAHLADFAAGGVNILRPYIEIEKDPIWESTGFNPAPVERVLAEVERISADAYLLPRVSLYAPQWWKEKHPEELARYGDGSTTFRAWGSDGHSGASFASVVWKEECSTILAELIRCLARHPTGRRTIGIELCCGGSLEWVQWGAQGGKTADYSMPVAREFRRWLKTRYQQDVERLRTAWNNAQVSFETANIPDRKERMDARYISFHDPATAGKIADYYRFANELIADVILHFCKVVKNIGERRLLTQAFGGYLFYHGGIRGFVQDNGQNCLSRLLASPDLDLITDIIPYEERAPGDPSFFWSLTDSILAHGKMPVHELDLTEQVLEIETCLTFPESVLGEGNQTPLTYRWPVALGPVFHGRDPNAQTWGVLKPHGGVGLCVKKFADWTSVFSTLPNMPAPLFRRFCRMAGVHVYSEDDVVVHACEELVAVHVGKAGKYDLRFPKKSALINWFDPTEKAKDVSEYSFVAKDTETKLFRLT